MIQTHFWAIINSYTYIIFHQPPDSRMAHLVNPNVSKGGAVNWLQPVTDEEYGADLG
jgi:hypothetical protein